ncbi:dol-P-Man:Man(5)GlcNAc(2)-PP-Dol alpha-1,3-mannosyltransferase [Aureococcus anophagefferens]|nr:dol-P-Man:Man(5)GlcNAc(2)-PP-Dol alpha-1,3-mannosyltransferase [Aureococcus anophagefferens]
MALKSGRNTVADIVKALCMSWTLCTVALVVGEACLVALIVKVVNYTEIDYSTYLEQAAMVTDQKVYDYGAIRGAQGPLVYPAGHVWLYAAVGRYAGGSILAAQKLFGLLYVLDAFVVARIYAGALAKDAFPPVLLAVLALSKRAHSVFALRLFNDGPVALLSHASVLAFMRGHDNLACVVFSLAVSVKMNALLYAPAVYLVLAARRGHRGAWLRIVLFVRRRPGARRVAVSHDGPDGLRRERLQPRPGLQALLVRELQVGALRGAPAGEHVTALADCDGPFASSAFKVASLGAHALALVALAERCWLRRRGGFAGFFASPQKRGPFSPAAAARALLACNFVGVACARSLHFQFCVWYANTLPFLLATTKLPLAAKAALLVAVEAAWNPWGGSETSSPASSLLLTAAHAAILAALLAAAPGDKGAAKTE